MSKMTRSVIVVAAVVLFSMLLGRTAGAWAHAHYAENIQFNAAPGFEGTGSIGLLVVIVFLTFLSAYSWVKEERAK